MLATSSRTLLQFSEAERPLGERLLKLAAETDRAEGYREPHAVEIARLAEKLGQRLGLRGIDLSALKFAALAHDLGERNMKREYLLRTGGLTWEEQLDLWRHPIIGEQAAADLKLPRLAQLLIRWHHEWWNGQGYPDGLAGTAIPLGARILRVVDTYCALLADRPYRARQEGAQVEQFITDQAGLETDPRVIKELLALLAEEHPAFEPASPEPAEFTGGEMETATSAPFISPWETAPQSEDEETEMLTYETDPQRAPNEATPAFEEAAELVSIASTSSATANLAVTEAEAEAELAIDDLPAAPALDLNQTETVTESAAVTAPLLPPARPVEIEVPDRLPAPPLQIVALHHAQEHFWPVAQWVYEQWWATPDNSVQIVSEQLKEHLTGQPLPSTLIAVADGQPIGSISLVEHAVAGRLDLTPCLTALFVLPEHRHRGVGTRLLDAAYTRAKALGAEHVFFAVPEQEDFFARRGWHIYEPALGARALVVLYKA
jgi:GNAT superfamily N-acetyltransferase